MADSVGRKWVVGADGNMQEVRFFSDSALRESIDSALASVTTDSAVIEFEKNETGLNAAIAARLNGQWSIAAAYTRDGWGDGVGAKVRFEW